MNEILHCEDICPLPIGSANRITRDENRIYFEKDVLKDGDIIGIIGVSVKLNPKYATTFTGSTIDKGSPACTHLVRRYDFVLEQHNGMVLSGIHKCKYISSALSDHCVNSSGNKLSPLERLRIQRTEYSEEIPSKVIHSDSGINSKARKGWFQNAVGKVELALIFGEIRTPKQKEAANRLLSMFADSEEFKRQELTKKEDIEEADRLIDIILDNQSNCGC